MASPDDDSLLNSSELTDEDESFQFANLGDIDTVLAPRPDEIYSVSNSSESPKTPSDQDGHGGHHRIESFSSDSGLLISDSPSSLSIPSSPSPDENSHNPLPSHESSSKEAPKENLKETTKPKDAKEAAAKRQSQNLMRSASIVVFQKKLAMADASSSPSTMSNKKKLKDLLKEEENFRKAMSILPDLSFQVIKIHHLLKVKRDKRILKLMNDKIVTCKGKKIVRSFPYDSVNTVKLIDPHHFSVSFDKAHTFFYETPIALQITQLILCRLSKRQRLSQLQQNVEFHKKLQTDLEKDFLTTNNIPHIFGSTDAEKKIWSLWTNNASNERLKENKTISEFTKSFYLLERHPEKALPSLKNFIDGLTGFICEERKNYLNQMFEKTCEAIEKECKQKGIEKPKKYPTLEEIVFFALEQKLYVPFHSRIEKIIIKTMPEITKRIENYTKKMEILRKKDQDFFEVAEKNKAPDNWVDAIQVLNSIELYDSVTEKMKIILQAAKTIFGTHQKFLAQKKKDKAENSSDSAITMDPNNFISADDFIPIFSYVIALSDKIENPIMLSETLQALVPRHYEIGEHGYYLTVFCSCVNSLEDMHVEGFVPSETTATSPTATEPAKK